MHICDTLCVMVSRHGLEVRHHGTKCIIVCTCVPTCDCFWFVQWCMVISITDYVCVHAV